MFWWCFSQSFDFSYFFQIFYILAFLFKFFYQFINLQEKMFFFDRMLYFMVKKQFWFYSSLYFNYSYFCVFSNTVSAPLPHLTILILLVSAPGYLAKTYYFYVFFIFMFFFKLLEKGWKKKLMDILHLLTPLIGTIHFSIIFHWFFFSDPFFLLIFFYRFLITCKFFKSWFLS